jgi:nicotinamidase-related amidase
MVHGEGYMQWDGWQQLDVAEPVRPRPGDTMMVTTGQFDDWLRERGITTLLYTGFATNLCILDSPAAMKAMRSLGYRCVIIREGTLGVEFPETIETLTHTRAALQYIEAWVGYSASAFDLLQGLRDLAPRK